VHAEFFSPFPPFSWNKNLLMFIAFSLYNTAAQDISWQRRKKTPQSRRKTADAPEAPAIQQKLDTKTGRWYY